MQSSPWIPSTDTTPAVMSVAALNQVVAKLLERHIPLTWVAGEISNFTRASSGHWYFTLKDDSAQVRAVMFRGRAQYADFLPREGDRVEVRVLVTLYAARGDYQLSVEAIRRAGVGNLYEAFLRLKAALAAEGLFDAARKRPLPVFPRTLGIVTSLQAAALRDVLTTLRRRAAHLQIWLYPTAVQGQGAAAAIASAIASAEAHGQCELLLVCRGGGSIEDLWAFNEEVVARTIAHCAIPVITGIGHETDTTIADYAADLRAATPTAAAELAVRPRADWLKELQGSQQLLQRAMQRLHGERSQSLDHLSRRLHSPATAIAARRAQLRQAALRLQYAARVPLQQARSELQQLRQRVYAAQPDSHTARNFLQQWQQRLQQGIRHRQQQQATQLAALSAQLEMLNPQRTLERGYAILSDRHGHVLRSTGELQPQQTLRVRLADGSADLGISSVQASLD